MHTTAPLTDCSIIFYIVEMRIFVLLNSCNRIDEKFLSKYLYGSAHLTSLDESNSFAEAVEQKVSHQAAMRSHHSETVVQASKVSVIYCPPLNAPGSS